MRNCWRRLIGKPDDGSLTIERLKEVLCYNPETGVFTRRKTGRGYKLGPVGWTRPDNGYVEITVDYITYLAHRLAWFYMKGAWPIEEVDHKNRIRNDIRWDNLRAATPIQNRGNLSRPNHNTSGVKGVSWHKKSQTWRAAMSQKNKHIHLGFFTTIEAAAEAYKDAANSYFGEEFAHLG